MPGRGTTDAIFAARQVIEKHREMQKELHLVFIDLDVTCALQARFKLNNDPTSAIPKCNMSALLQN